MCAEKRRLKVVLCWHMHQPEYRNLSTGEYQLPWTYLHALKDYVDMAGHLEAVPQARAVVNFTPVLLEQIEDYAEQASGFLRDGRPIRDPLLAQLVAPAMPTARAERLAILGACLRANEQRLIRRFGPYRRLAELARWCAEHGDMVTYLDDQFLADLLVWYHLAWLGETVRRTDVRVRRLQDKQGGYSLHDRRELLSLIAELLSGLVGRYAVLAAQGRVELSVTPYAHPIIPLLLDLHSAGEAMPDVRLPRDGYPGGEARARWQIEQGIAVFERHFGFRPAGCWPSEGAVSGPTLALLNEYGFRWTASGESVLHNSLHEPAGGPGAGREKLLYRPYRLRDEDVACFFRDDGLSDLIGFTYSDWHGDDAVANLVHHLENIAEVTTDAVVPVILDGENAWEYYPDNGYHFLSGLYERLAAHPRLQLTTFSDCLAGDPTPGRLDRLVAGSWVYGTFSTWIGDRDKNRGWDMLREAKLAFDAFAGARDVDAGRLDLARHQLAVCEGSDWFWWFGDYNPADTVTDFDRLFRMHLANLYQLLGQEPPEYLSHAFSHGTGRPERGGVMRHGQSQG